MKSRAEFLRAQVLVSGLFFSALICSLAWTLAMDSAKLSFVSAKSRATELVSVFSSDAFDWASATARKLF
jgi:hypothetical protein